MIIIIKVGPCSDNRSGETAYQFIIFPTDPKFDVTIFRQIRVDLEVGSQKHKFVGVCSAPGPNYKE